jgi:hypothetical protein
VKAGTAVASGIWFMVLQMLRVCAGQGNAVKFKTMHSIMKPAILWAGPVLNTYQPQYGHKKTRCVDDNTYILSPFSARLTFCFV